MVKLSDYNYLKDYQSAERALNGSDSKVIGNNTELVRRPNGDIVVELHGHGVVKYRQDGRVQVSSAGYKTTTTKDRINRYTPSSFKVVQRQGRWYAKGRGPEKTEFRDGMEV